MLYSNPVSWVSCYKVSRAEKPLETLDNPQIGSNFPVGERSFSI